ncbi:hypothetical protein KAT24_01125 [Candidatus Pacearchaeota archaeon]|nr:hypothetical protein [Candidatus Pacearchaeota archaeon]
MLIENMGLESLMLCGIFFEPGADIPLYGNVPSLPSEPLTIRDFPASGFQLHIHEEPGGKPLLKDYSGKKISELNSYDAAMADLWADKLDFRKILRDLGVKHY